MSFFVLSSGFFLLFYSFPKKLMVLLSLEMIFLGLIFYSFFLGFSSQGSLSFSLLMVFLTFMVLDSVLGISLLVCSCRSSDFLLGSRSLFL